YKTGDLSRWNIDGNIEYIGRNDFQVKIRGYRIELAEIENAILHHNKIKDALILDRETETGEKYLCAYIVPANEAEFEPGEIRKYLGGQLPEYMIPNYFIPMKKIPLNANGKFDIKALPEPETEAGAGTGDTPPRDGIEEELTQIWSEILQHPKEKIGIDTGFFELGGHSLKATILTARIHKAMDVQIPLVEIFSRQTIRAQAEYIKKATKTRFLTIPKAEEKEYYPLSSAQKRLYIIHSMMEESIAYNLTDHIIVERTFGKEQMEAVFKTLIERHESFRTGFTLKDGEPVQEVQEDVEFRIEEIENTAGSEPAEVVRAFVRPFNLNRPPLVRAGLLPLEGEDGLLLVDMHHIISDGTSH
ncbi:MAG: hypothetical protein GY757_47065, partial [bacterium]|nr:hypothetical protein [bacterium]